MPPFVLGPAERSNPFAAGYLGQWRLLRRPAFPVLDWAAAHPGWLLTLGRAHAAGRRTAAGAEVVPQLVREVATILEVADGRFPATWPAVLELAADLPGDLAPAHRLLLDGAEDAGAAAAVRLLAREAFGPRAATTGLDRHARLRCASGGLPAPQARTWAGALGLDPPEVLTRLAGAQASRLVAAAFPGACAHPVAAEHTSGLEPAQRVDAILCAATARAALRASGLLPRIERPAAAAQSDVTSLSA
jgi:hypothetical protein